MYIIGITIEIESRLLIARGWGFGEWGMSAHGTRILFGGDEHIMELDSGDNGISPWLPQITKSYTLKGYFMVPESQ